MAGYSINKNNYDLLPSAIASVTGTFTLAANAWINGEQSVQIPLEFFCVNTININPDELSTWSQYGVYASSESVSLNTITFTCDSTPATALHFTVTQIPVNTIGDFEGAGGTLDVYTGADTSIVIPDGINVISDNVFAQKNITSVLLPLSPMTIGAQAFSGCSSLASFKGDTSSAIGVMTDEVVVHSIGAYAFKDCTSLTAIVLDVTGSISDYAFKDCTGLTSISFNGGIYGGTKNAFDGCTNVTSITIGGAGLFSDVDYSFTDSLSAECLADIINALGSGFGDHTLTIGATNRARLTAEQIAAAEAKGWSIV